MLLYSCKGPGLGSQHPHGGLRTACNSSFQGLWCPRLTSVGDLQPCGAHMYFQAHTNFFLKKGNSAKANKNTTTIKKRNKTTPLKWGEGLGARLGRCRVRLEAGDRFALLGQNDVSVYQTSFLPGHHLPDGHRDRDTSLYFLMCFGTSPGPDSAPILVVYIPMELF